MIFIGTPDHWHAIISIAAMKNGKNLTYIFENGARIYHGGGWSFRCQLVKPDGSAIEGLRFVPD